MQEKLFVDSDMIGSRYASEMRRRRDQSSPYPPKY
jgi:hypothetical protein